MCFDSEFDKGVDAIKGVPFGKGKSTSRLDRNVPLQML